MNQIQPAITPQLQPKATATATSTSVLIDVAFIKVPNQPDTVSITIPSKHCGFWQTYKPRLQFGNAPVPFKQQLNALQLCMRMCTADNAVTINQLSKQPVLPVSSSNGANASESF